MTLTLTTLRATIAAVLLLAAPAQGLVQSGHAVGAPDGDTANESIAGAAHRHVRITGIQAMEGRECHGAATTARLNRLIDAAHGRVRLTAMRASSYSLGRPRRAIAGRIGRRWIDFGRGLVREGYVLWDANPVEDEWNSVYSRLAQRAGRRHRRLWAASSCGAGP